jgi:DNA-binding response OmpR family regulator
MRVLIIEDDREIARNISDYLQKEGFVIDWSADGEEGEFMASEESYDAVILDINLPIQNGFEVLESLRDKGVGTPVLILTARGEVEDKVKGLNLGADDYLAKPFSMVELMARLLALIRRDAGRPRPLIVIDDLQVNPLSHRVVRGGREISLTSKEFAVLNFLAHHHGEVVTRTMILDHVWGSDFETMSNVVDVYIRNLRRKIDLPHKNALIHTVRGSGYVLGERK